MDSNRLYRMLKICENTIIMQQKKIDELQNELDKTRHIAFAFYDCIEYVPSCLKEKYKFLNRK